MLRRVLVIAASIVAIGGIWMAPAGAGGNYGGCNASVSDTTPAPGQTITVTGSGAVDGGEVTASLDGTEVGSGTADAEGDFSFDATIPTTASGSETLNVSCGADRGVMPITLTITATGGLPATGSDTGSLVMLGAGAVALGATAVVIARRRARRLAA